MPGSRTYAVLCVACISFFQRFCSAAAADKKITAAIATKAETEHMRVALDNVKRRQPGTQKWLPEVAMPHRRQSVAVKGIIKFQNKLKVVNNTQLA